jgi:hypothetical protein
MEKMMVATMDKKWAEMTGGVLVESKAVEWAKKKAETKAAKTVCLLAARLAV